MGARHLTGRMNEVTRYKRLLSFRGDPHTHMAWSMAGCRLEPYFSAQFVIGFDPIQKTGGKHGLDAITHIIAG